MNVVGMMVVMVIYGRLGMVVITVMFDDYEGLLDVIKQYLDAFMLSSIQEAYNVYTMLFIIKQNKRFNNIQDVFTFLLTPACASYR